MARKSEEDLTKHTLNLFSGDYATIQNLYPDIGASPIIRRIIRQFIVQAESKSKPTPVELESTV